MKTPTIHTSPASNSLEVVVVTIKFPEGKVVESVHRPLTESAIDNQIKTRRAFLIGQIGGQRAEEIKNCSTSRFVALGVMPRL